MDIFFLHQTAPTPVSQIAISLLGNLIGVGNDLAPHYYHVLRFFRESHPGTLIGDPGRFQGFNTGVVLFNLDKMRKSELYNSIVENKAGIVDKLAEKYQFKSHLGKQRQFFCFLNSFTFSCFPSC